MLRIQTLTNVHTTNTLFLIKITLNRSAHTKGFVKIIKEKYGGPRHIKRGPMALLSETISPNQFLNRFGSCFVEKGSGSANCWGHYGPWGWPSPIIGLAHVNDLAQAVGLAQAIRAHAIGLGEANGLLPGSQAIS